MSTLALTLPAPLAASQPWYERLRLRLRRAVDAPCELRIDVPAEPDNLLEELDTLYQRLRAGDGGLRACRPLGPLGPQWQVWHREADGEHFLYVEDLAESRLAGYIVFNRLREVNRRVDPHVRSPHTKLDPRYRRCGIASTLYTWALEQGFCLLSGARQSAAAHALWQALGRDYPLGYVDVRQRQPTWLGYAVSPSVQDALSTRLMLLAPGHPAYLLTPPVARRAAGAHLRSLGAPPRDAWQPRARQATASPARAWHRT